MEKKTRRIRYEGSGLPPTEDDLFQLSAYPLLDIKEATAVLGPRKHHYQELAFEEERLLFISELEFIYAYKNKDWKEIQSLANRERDRAFCIGATQLRYACQFLACYCEVKIKQTTLDSLYEQALKAIVQTRRALELVDAIKQINRSGFGIGFSSLWVTE
jgi:two-component system, OmpR family, aerobic respiration control sensor histidine kinase ArcB